MEVKKTREKEKKNLKDQSIPSFAAPIFIGKSDGSLKVKIILWILYVE